MANDHWIFDYKQHGRNWTLEGGVTAPHGNENGYEEIKALVERQHQSPINLDPVGGGAAELHAAYGSKEIGYLNNNGHAWEVDYKDGGGTLQFRGRTFNLAQFHFHASSEHTRGGRRYPMEAHLVHIDEHAVDPQHPQGHELAVIGILFELSSTNNVNLDKFWSNMPLKHEKKSVTLSFDAADLFPSGYTLPQTGGYQTYTGSLTTPPCYDEVSWIVLENPNYASANQVNALASNMRDLAGNENYRDIQPIGTRTIRYKERETGWFILGGQLGLHFCKEKRCLYFLL
ncbi:carbonic anhydrase family protein [Chloroflexi bacterium TSY]|nr:carbonic anhydrase family protein [Chloroflexi bacterium TSY]